MGTEEEKFTILSPYENFWVVDAMSRSLRKDKTSFLQKQLLIQLWSLRQHRAYIALLILASTSYSALLCWLLLVLEEDVTEYEGGFYVDIDE